MEEEKLLLEGNEEKVEELAPTPTTAEGTSPEVPADTDTVSEPTPVVEEDGAMETSYKTFTQDDVDKLVGETRVKTREKTFNYIYNRYGVKNEEEMDALVSNAQRFDTLKEEYDSEKLARENEKKESDSRLSEMSEQIALMQSGVDNSRFDDVKLILKGKGLDVTLDNINAELDTHPEWKPVSVSASEEKEKHEEVESAPTVTTRIKALGNEPKPAPEMSEEEKAEKIFKMKFH